MFAYRRGGDLPEREERGRGISKFCVLTSTDPWITYAQNNQSNSVKGEISEKRPDLLLLSLPVPHTQNPPNQFSRFFCV